MGSQQVIFRGDLIKAYRDPLTYPSLLAYCPEVHASSNCHRALKGGSYINVGLTDQVWCDECTTPDREAATLRWDGVSWYQTAVADPEVPS